MKKLMTIAMTICFAMIFLCSCTSKTHNEQSQQNADTSKVIASTQSISDSSIQALIMAPEEIVFVPIDSNDRDHKGVMIHVLFGDLNKKGPLAFLARLPNGYSAGWHSHSSDYYLTVVKGAYHEWCRGEVEGKAIGAGGTIFMPANREHNNRAEADLKDGYTLTYSYWPNGFDVAK